MLTDTLRRTLSRASGPELVTALGELGWPDLLDDAPELAVPLVFRLLGETGAHAPLLLDVLRHAGAAPSALPFAGGRWVEWSESPSAGGPGADGVGSSGIGYDANSRHAGETSAGGHRPDRDGSGGDLVPGSVDEALPLRAAAAGATLPAHALAEGRRALGWWLLGTGHAMLALARTHVLERTQFGRPLASFQAVRHRLAETLVALDGAEAALLVADEAAAAATVAGTAPAVHGLDPAEAATHAALLAKAAAGQAGLTAARHCQQVLGGIGFTAEHALQGHVRRTLVLDGLLGSARELTREAGAYIRNAGAAPRLAQL
ncbi:acyl-CoA dehydrogenase family protein [Nocardia asteroides]|uniref:acyl-CoA dehydrogenase family protein n=1 Tax=Nocardia asteroides TaxID=1824 RepID=UPI001E390CD4|nr:acyl-CoA dehydrogenase family protein [Nocardia asteroides]UGT65190.1 acyl-CoA dehydrogenase [Nocardia asteroides]